MEVNLVVNKKEWIRCYCCGHERKIPKIYRGRMYWNDKTKEYECNRCDFSFSPKDLKPKKEFTDIVNLMKTVSNG